eukprot:scaffold21801_cov72-Phaeocystis_antarctica.AAC.1
MGDGLPLAALHPQGPASLVCIKYGFAGIVRSCVLSLARLPARPFERRPSRPRLNFDSPICSKVSSTACWAEI